MSEFSTNLLDRHLGTCDVVEPRGHSRFETEGAGYAKPLPIDHSGTDETGDENLEHQNSVVRIPENHSVGPPINWSELQRIDPDVKLTVDHTGPVDAMGENLERHDSVDRTPENHSVQPPVNWIETQRIDPEVKLPVDHTDQVDAMGDNLERRDGVVRIPENHVVVPPVNSIEPQRIDPEVKWPVDHIEPADAMGDNLERQDNLIQLPENDSISADVNAPKIEPHLHASGLRQQDWHPVKPKPVEQANPKEENAPFQVIHRHSTVETESQPTLPGDLPQYISDTNPTEEINAPTSKLGYRFEGGLENRIRTMLARLHDRQNVRPAEHSETNNLDRSLVTRPDTAGDAKKDRAAQPALVASLFDESKKLGSSDTDKQRQYAFPLDNPDLIKDGSLEPPMWFSDMQAEFNRRWNELNSKSEPEPVINVNIGRVEVRATQAQTPKKPKEKAKPTGVMSLDEYLSQREKRGRM